MKLNGKLARALFLLSTLTVLFFFQNCGEGFESTETSSVSGSGDPILDGNPTDPSSQLPGSYKGERSYTEFQKCVINTNYGLNRVVECMTVNNIELGPLTQQLVNECRDLTGSSIPIDIAVCLGLKQVPLIGYRHFTQFDVDACNIAVGPNNIGQCLKNRGFIEFLPVTVLQSKVQSCIQAVGLGKVEICFRQNRDLPRNLSLTQYDLKLCSMIYGSTDEEIKTCLENNELWPSSLTLNDFSICRNEAGFPSLASCLRSKLLLGPVVLVQAHVERCIQAVGVVSAGLCLISNNLLSSDVNNADVLDCINTSRSQVPVCLANKKIIPKVMTQAHLNACAKLNSPTNLEECLKTNGVWNGIITQALITNCATATGDFNQVMKCLRFNQRRLPKVVMNADIVSCMKLVGQENVFSCLNLNGFEVSGFSQDDIDSCIAELSASELGTGAVAGCLRSRDHLGKVVMNAHIDSCRLHNGEVTSLYNCLNANAMTLTENMNQVNFTACDTAIVRAGAGNMMTCLANNEWVSPIPSQSFFEACVDYVGIENVEACLKSHGVLPPLTTQARVNDCVTAGSGSHANVMQCLQEGNFIAPKLEDLMASGGVFAVKCLTCHSEGGAAVASFDITVRDQVLSYVDDGFSALNTKSELMDRINSNVQGYRMPPNNNQRLTATENAMVRYWILNGAQ